MRRRAKSLILLGLSILCSLAVYFLCIEGSCGQDHVPWKQPGIADKDPLFVPVTDFYTRTLHYVCIIDHPIQTKQLKETQNRSIVAYKQKVAKAELQGIVPVIRLLDEVPENFVVVRKHPAYFVATRGTFNIYHNVMDLAVPLYHMLRMTQRLGSPAQLYYLPRKHKLEKAELTGEFIIHDILRALGVFSSYYNIKDAPFNVCYENAVFYAQDPWVWDISERKNHIARDMAAYLTSKLGIDRTKCSHNTTHLQLTIIQRSTRRIMNANEMAQTGREAGFITNIVDIGGLPLRQQLHLAACSDVLVGVHGAGLVWSIFMEPNKVLIEIAWPKQKWGFYYTEAFQADLQLHALQYEVASEDVYINYDHMINDELNNEQDKTKKRIDELTKNKKIKAHYKNPYKYADVVLQPQKLRSLLVQAKQMLSF